MAKAAKQQVTERMYEIIRSPHITEKATMGSADGKVTFKVPMDATKPEIKLAVETLFKVKVTAVNTSILKGKIKRFRGHLGKRNDIKKAVITLGEGQTIDLATGL